MHGASRLRLLAGYAEWFVGGSYSYDLMCWRDLDVYVLDPQHDLKQCFEIGYELTRRLSAVKARFTNNLGSEPNGLYWGIKLGDERRGAWKLDVWFLDPQGYEHHADYCEVLRQRLTAEHRSAILEIKEATGADLNTATPSPAIDLPRGSLIVA